MPYPSGHRAEIKGKIIQSARRLFNQHGFESVSLDQIMSGAGLTRGGFYTYFESKAIYMPKCWVASSLIRNGRVVGMASR